MSWHILKLDLNSARWMPKLVSIDAQSYAALTSKSLPATIGPLQDNLSLFHYVIGILGILRYNRNLTLQTFELFSAYARFYNAAASLASRLRSAGSLAIKILCFHGRLGMMVIWKGKSWESVMSLWSRNVSASTLHQCSIFPQESVILSNLQGERKLFRKIQSLRNRGYNYSLWLRRGNDFRFKLSLGSKNWWFDK